MRTSAGQCGPEQPQVLVHRVDVAVHLSLCVTNRHQRLLEIGDESFLFRRVEGAGVDQEVRDDLGGRRQLGDGGAGAVMPAPALESRPDLLSALAQSGTKWSQLNGAPLQESRHGRGEAT